MKKLSSILFIGGLLVLSISSIKCARPNDNSGTPVSGAPITKPKVDSSGADIDIQVDLNTVVSPATPAPNAKVLLFNNYNDWIAFQKDTSYRNKNILVSTCDGSGIDTFHKVKPCSNTTSTPSYFPGTNTGYNYYLYVTYVNNANVPPSLMVGWPGSYSGQANAPIIVPINNNKGVGVQVLIAVN